MPRTCVISSTTFYKESDEVRAQLALRFAAEARRLGYPLVVVDGGSPADFISALREEKAVVLSEIRLPEFEGKRQPFGPGRRQAMAEAAKLAGEDGIVAWVEPEKVDMVRHLGELTEQFDGRANLVIPRRLSLASYPSDQQFAEPLGNNAFRLITGRELDMWFGPRIMDQEALKRFLSYDGRFSDMWDSIFVPVLECLRDGLMIKDVQVSYTHPREQTAEEEGSLDYLEKRIVQLGNIVPALRKAAADLGLKP